ncbi:MAG: hypothetical protein LLG06_04185 [Desulfobacteraceae bacterium]|nr:hypothetical protein [Desulfobacteraceae bacterium]
MKFTWFIRSAKELYKVFPFVVFILLNAVYLGDASQLKLALYYLTVITLTVLVFHVGRKFMYPTVSIEAHCRKALDEGNAASAMIVITFLGFQAAMSWLTVLCIVAMITK